MTTAVMEKRVTKAGVELCPQARVGRLTLTRRYVPPLMPFDPPECVPTATWYAVCDCGSNTATSEVKLVIGVVTACRECMDRKDGRNGRAMKAPIVPADPTLPVETVGTKVGQLELIERVDDKTWKVKCACGNMLQLSSKTLFTKHKRISKCVECAGKQ